MTPKEKARQIVAVIGATGISDDPKLWEANIATALHEARAEAFEAAVTVAEALKDGPGLDSEWYQATAKDAAAAIRALAAKDSR